MKVNQLSATWNASLNELVRFDRNFVEISNAAVLEFLNAAGEWQKDVILHKLSLGKDEATKAKLSVLVDKCSSLTGDDVCQKSYKTHNCYWGNIKH